MSDARRAWVALCRSLDEILSKDLSYEALEALSDVTSALARVAEEEEDDNEEG
jgi:hypothetical protein